MPDRQFPRFAEYEAFMSECVGAWAPWQALALVAGTAERWLPAYQAFSTREDWGDPDLLAAALDAVWKAAEGASIGPGDLDRFQRGVEDATPHLDDFDAADALIAAVTVDYALQACADRQQGATSALQGVLGVFEGLAADTDTDPESDATWRGARFRAERRAQLALIDAIDGAEGTADAVAGIRQQARALAIRPKKQAAPKGPPRISNQAAFERYRGYIETDLRSPVSREPDPPPGEMLFGVRYLSYWSGRYARRQQTVDGTFGLLADAIGQQALMARNRALDDMMSGVPDWEGDVRKVIDLAYKHTYGWMWGVPSVEAPHTSGPSLRRLWLEARKRTGDDLAAWHAVREWGLHRPAAWEAEDRRRKRGRVLAPSELGGHLAQALSWRETGDPFFPWSTEVEGVEWRVRVNDFPDELLYSLCIGDRHVGDFHDWPDAWTRPAS